MCLPSTSELGLRIKKVVKCTQKNSYHLGVVYTILSSKLAADMSMSVDSCWCNLDLL